jgi:hypothetical protein
VSSFELLGFLFLVPVFILVSAFLLAKNQKHIPRTSSFIFGLFCACIGVFGLLYTLNLFANDQAIPPLRMASSFAKVDHPFGFAVCTVLDLGIGVALLGFGVRAMYRSLSNHHLHVETDSYR